MWIVVRLFSDCSTLDDVDIEKFNTRDSAVEYLIKAVTEDIVNAEEERSTVVIEEKYRAKFDRLKAGEDLRIEYGANSWELRNL